jgi:hypothetical protein
LLSDIQGRGIAQRILRTLLPPELGNTVQRSAGADRLDVCQPTAHGSVLISGKQEEIVDIELLGPGTVIARWRC